MSGFCLSYGARSGALNTVSSLMADKGKLSYLVSTEREYCLFKRLRIPKGIDERLEGRLKVAALRESIGSKEMKVFWNGLNPKEILHGERVN